MRTKTKQNGSENLLRFSPLKTAPMSRLCGWFGKTSELFCSCGKGLGLGLALVGSYKKGKTKKTNKKPAFNRCVDREVGLAGYQNVS